MTDSGSELVENLLARPDVREQWEGHYRTAENERFCEAAFDYIARELEPAPGATILDVGWLARGFEAVGLRLERRAAGRFSEAYATVGSPALKRLVHGFNDLWFGHVGAAGPAYGRVLFFRKTK